MTKYNYFFLCYSWSRLCYARNSHCACPHFVHTVLFTFLLFPSKRRVRAACTFLESTLKPKAKNLHYAPVKCRRNWVRRVENWCGVIWCLLCIIITSFGDLFCFVYCRIDLWWLYPNKNINWQNALGERVDASLRWKAKCIKKFVFGLAHCSEVAPPLDKQQIAQVAKGNLANWWLSRFLDTAGAVVRSTHMHTNTSSNTQLPKTATWKKGILACL